MKKDGRKKLGRNRPVTKPALKKAVELAGGVTKLALEIRISKSKISDWLYTDIQIPAHHVHKIVKATGGKVKAEELRPDVFVN
jgi:DNA-binding transcriptional regulator YdaS (Cro superfamily)